MKVSFPLVSASLFMLLSYVLICSVCIHMSIDERLPTQLGISWSILLEIIASIPSWYVLVCVFCYSSQRHGGIHWFGPQKNLFSSPEMGQISDIACIIYAAGSTSPQFTLCWDLCTKTCTNFWISLVPRQSAILYRVLQNILFCHLRTPNMPNVKLNEVFQVGSGMYVGAP